MPSPHDSIVTVLCDHLSPFQYTNLRNRAAEMKDNYEDQLERERETKGGADPQAVTTEVTLGSLSVPYIARSSTLM